MSLDSEKTRMSKDVKDIPLLYESIMDGYAGSKTDAMSILDDCGLLMELYAPGYDNNGVADISAKCL
ncbi:MAG: hypothetical protein J6O49_01815 [Bacteroidaceae bacterium]|nr:hypothetical protein [Bacteroidaceae bacterium]